MINSMRTHIANALSHGILLMNVHNFRFDIGQTEKHELNTRFYVDDPIIILYTYCIAMPRSLEQVEKRSFRAAYLFWLEYVDYK